MALVPSIHLGLSLLPPFSFSLAPLTEDPARAVGWLIVGGLGLQVLLRIGGVARRLVFEKQREDHERERFALEIKAAQLRVVTAEQAKTAWNGYRKFMVAKKIPEADDACTFHLVPHDGKPLPSFKPGQYLTFNLKIPGHTEPLVRCYSLSDSWNPKFYRVTIKRWDPPAGSDLPPGRSSNFFHDRVKEGDILDVKAPAGHFFLDVESERPVVLLSAGVGVTPMVSMANTLLDLRSTREIWFFFGGRSGERHLFKSYMTELAAKHANVRLRVCYSQPHADDVLGRDYQHHGRLTGDYIKSELPSKNYDFFLCGPGPFMENITEGLWDWGVPDAWVHFEAFGPASVKRRTKAPAPVAATLTGTAPASVEVTFAKSGIRATWNGSHTSVLELAEAQGLKMEAGCRAGNCGACLVAVTSGEVEYSGGHGAEVERGSCLPCICTPKGNLVLDA